MLLSPARPGTVYLVQKEVSTDIQFTLPAYHCLERIWTHDLSGPQGVDIELVVDNAVIASMVTGDSYEMVRIDPMYTTGQDSQSILLRAPNLPWGMGTIKVIVVISDLSI